MNKLLIPLLLCALLPFTLNASDMKVHRFTTSEQDWGTNAYWIKNNQGIVIIDSLLRVSDAYNLAQVLKAQNQPVLGLILTHPHPDHYSGITVLKGQLGDFPVYATSATASALEQDFNQFKQFSAEQFSGDVYLDGPPQVDKLIDTSHPLILGGMDFIVEDLGEGESANMMVIYQPESRALFVGDILMAHHHYYIGSGNTDNILSQFNHLQSHYQAKQVTVYGGHGDPGALNLLSMQAEYVIKTVQAFESMLAVPANLHKGKPTDNAIQQATQTILTAYPYLNHYGYQPGTIVHMNLMSLFRRQQSVIETPTL